MFKYFVILAIAVTVMGAPAPKDEERETYEIIPIVKSETNKHEDGSYDTNYESGDGTIRQEEATVIDAGTDSETLEVKGSYKYINDEGQEVEVFYTAGVNGFVPYGSIINPEISAVAEAAKDLPKETEETRKANKASERA